MLPKNKTGFTLIEILITIFIMGLMVTTAVVTYVETKNTFVFLEEYKKLLLPLNTARTLALSRKEVNGTVPKRFGIKLTEANIVIFADSGEKEFQFDPQAGDSCFELGVIVDCFVPSTFNSEGKYSLQAFDSKNSPLTFPLLIFYESGSAEVNIFHKENPEQLEKNWDSGHDFIVLGFHEKSAKREKYIAVFQVYPKIEEHDTLQTIYEN